MRERERQREKNERVGNQTIWECERERESGWKIQRERLFEVRKKCVLLWVRKGEIEGKTERELRDCVVREREREQMCDWSATGQSDGTKRNKNANSKYLNRVFNQFYLPSNCLVRRFNKSVELNYTNPLKIYVFNLFVQNRTVKNKSIFASLGLCSAHLSLYLVTHPPIRAHFLEKTTNVKQEREREREEET